MNNLRGLFVLILIYLTMGWFVYVIQSQSDGIRYVGMSENLERRLAEHNAGKSKFTSGHTPWELIYAEECASTQEARLREKYLKSSAGKRFLNKKLGIDLFERWSV